MKDLDQSQTTQVAGGLRLKRCPPFKRPPITTLAIGEEDGGGVTTMAVGEEDMATTLAIGEEDGGTGVTIAAGGALGSF